jgi:hypothetical protein
MFYRYEQKHIALPILQHGMRRNASGRVPFNQANFLNKQQQQIYFDEFYFIKTIS